MTQEIPGIEELQLSIDRRIDRIVVLRVGLGSHDEPCSLCHYVPWFRKLPLNPVKPCKSNRNLYN